MARYEEERWLTASGSSNYEVSDRGGVRRRTPGRGTHVGRPLKPKPRGEHHKDYLFVTLQNADNTARSIAIHRLVMLTFIGADPLRPHVNHKNGVTTDNRLENLEWVTPGENNRHAFAIGLKTGNKGEANPHSKLTEADVREIRRRRGSDTQVTLAKEFGVARRTIRNVHSGASWRCVA